jgi:hypothetical protein
VFDVTNTRQNVRKNLFNASSASSDSEQFETAVIDRLDSLMTELFQIKQQMYVFNLITAKETRFLVLPGNCELMSQIISTLSRMVDLPFHTLPQVNFQTKLVRKFDTYRYLVDVYITNTSAGGGVYSTCNNVWHKVFSDRLSRDISWASIGESSICEGEEGGRKTRGMGKEKRQFHQLRSENLELCQLLTRE